MRLCCVLLVALAAMPACRRQEAVEATAAAAEGRLSPAQLSFLKFAPVAEVEATSLADLNGTIEFDEERTARLAAPVPGRVVQLLVQAGDRVEADQPLIAFESPEVKAAEAEYVRADADRTLARRAAERATRLRAAQAIAEKDYLQAQEEATKAAAEFARVTLKAPPGLRLTVVPSHALLSDGQHFRVLVRTEDGRLESRPVEVGAQVDGLVQVLSGVRVGEEVVSEGALFATRELANS